MKTPGIMPEIRLIRLSLGQILVEIMDSDSRMTVKDVDKVKTQISYIGRALQVIEVINQ